MCVSLCDFAYVYVCPIVSVSMCLRVCLCLSLSICLYASIYVLSVCMSLCQYVCLSVCLCVCLYLSALYYRFAQLSPNRFPLNQFYAILREIRPVRKAHLSDDRRACSSSSSTERYNHSSIDCSDRALTTERTDGRMTTSRLRSAGAIDDVGGGDPPTAVLRDWLYWSPNIPASISTLSKPTVVIHCFISQPRLLLINTI